MHLHLLFRHLDYTRAFGANLALTLLIFWGGLYIFI